MYILKTNINFYAFLYYYIVLLGTSSKIKKNNYEMKNIKLIVLLMILFFGYITISSNYNNDDKQCEIITQPSFYFDDEPYIDDIPFDTKEIYDSLMKI